MPFPPLCLYPKALDSDYNLFEVFNTTESKLSLDNMPWSQEISIVPVAPEQDEIWAKNGFANIEGELIYYDSVDYNDLGKINKLKGCARQLGSVKTKFNKAGTWIRSFVVAEHHNQLAEAILKTQNFIGRNFDPRQFTLDWRIRNLMALQVIFDDYLCPDVDFTFNIVSSDPVAGVLAQYTIQVTPTGSIDSFRLDFGDGQFTTTNLSGTHTYAINATIDPVVQVSNSQCQIVQTPIQRTNPTEPPAQVTTVFDITVTEAPPVPDFTIVPVTVGEPDINLPALSVPCISITGQVGPIPSVITGPTIQMVSQVTITANNPINITQSVVSIIGPSIPSLIVVDAPTIPPTIVIDPPIPPTIVIVPPQSTITLDFDVAEMPRLEVDWGTPPEMEVAMTFAKQVKTPQKFAADSALLHEFGTEFADLFDVSQSVNVQYEPVGIPSEITVIHSDIPDVKVDASALDSKKIQIDASSVNIPTNIHIHGPDALIPDKITHDASELIDVIKRIEKTSIKLDASTMPSTIKLETEANIPERIIVEMPEPIPQKILVESNIPNKIILEGPVSIPISIPENLGIPVIFPEKMPELEVVYKGAPIELKITMDQIVDKTAEGNNCVMITPCIR